MEKKKRKTKKKKNSDFVFDKKMVAPLAVGGFVVILYLIVSIVIVMAGMETLMKIVFIVVNTILVGIMIQVLVDRINDIVDGEEEA
jgi:hypothetical protein